MPKKIPYNPVLDILVAREDEQIACHKCEFVFCGASKSWRDHAAMAETELATRMNAMGAYVEPRTERPRVVLREYFCPRCGTLLETKTTVTE